MSTWDAILASTPVNTTTAKVVSNRREAMPQGDITREELIAIKDRLERKLRLLKHILRIDTKAKHKNLVYKTTHGMPTYRGAGNSPAVTEYLRIGHEMQRMNRALQAMRVAKSGAKAQLGGWKG